MLTAEKVAAFRTVMRGDVIQPNDPFYDQARSVWNAMIDRCPVLIARCAGTADVIASVRFARDNGLRVSVRGGGHNIAGSAVCDDGLMIDLSAMRAVHVDAEARIARVQGGALLGDLDHETQAFGLAAPGGVISTTGVAGLTLGGGFGWLSRQYGLAADNLLSVDLVTPQGDLVTASESEYADLFWGLRGGSGNFGVATSFEFRLHEVGPSVLFGPTVYRLEDAPAALRAYRDFAMSAPRNCCVWADLLTAPPLPFLPERFHGTRVLSLMQCYNGEIESGKEVLAPLRGHGEPIGDAVAPTPFTSAQSMLDGLYGKGMRNYWKANNYTDLSEPLLDLLTEAAASLPTPESDILIHQVGGAITDVAPEATAYPHRGAAFVITPGARWANPTDDKSCISWVRATADALARHAGDGVYVNFVSESEGYERDAYGLNYKRLAALKKKYDPENFFRTNQNVVPAD